jgi:hypothetical protein
LATTTGAMSWAGVLRTTGPARQGQGVSLSPSGPLKLQGFIFKDALEKKWCLHYDARSFHVRQGLLSFCTLLIMRLEINNSIKTQEVRTLNKRLIIAQSFHPLS